MRSAERSLLAAALISCVLLGCENKNDAVEPAPPEGAPILVIDRPATPSLQYAKVIEFGWSSYSGDEPAEIRYLWSAVVDTNGVYNPAFDIVKDLDLHPGRYEALWSRWISWIAPSDSGRTTILGDDENLVAGRYYIFAVEARDSRGKIGLGFTTGLNVRRFRIGASVAPLLTISDEYLVGFRFMGTNMREEIREIPDGIPLRFKWRADATDYGGTIAGYRYAWDLVAPASWDDPFRSDLTSAPEVTFYAGSHSLYIETIDIAGNRTLARIIIVVEPFSMRRSLLFVDDYYSTTMPVPDYSNPTEPAHDAFWLGICSKAQGFDPAEDVYDAAENGLRPPDLLRLGAYKNVIWTYSVTNNAWASMILFTPESKIGRNNYPLNYLAMFLLRGGHVWTCGQGQRGGGLAASLTRPAQSFPMNLACEILGNRDDCAGDRSGTSAMPYRDYCVTVLDKVDGVIRGTDGMPPRIESHFDVLSYALRDDSDPIVGSHPGLPERLDLWSEVTKPGRFCNPDDSLGPGGLPYVEVYDPAYWMALRGLSSQPCFHPMYRMRARSPESALDDAPVALWLTKYRDVVPEVSEGAAVAAPSFHFGFPLWFFRRSSVDSIASFVFDEWGIRKP